MTYIEPNNKNIVGYYIDADDAQTTQYPYHSSSNRHSDNSRGYKTYYVDGEWPSSANKELYYYENPAVGESKSLKMFYLDLQNKILGRNEIDRLFPTKIIILLLACHQATQPRMSKRTINILRRQMSLIRKNKTLGDAATDATALRRYGY